MNSGSPIVQCSVTDVHAMLLTADGQFVMLTLQDADNEHGVNLHCFNPSLPQVSKSIHNMYAIKNQRRVKFKFC